LGQNEKNWASKGERTEYQLFNINGLSQHNPASREKIRGKAGRGGTKGVGRPKNKKKARRVGMAQCFVDGQQHPKRGRENRRGVGTLLKEKGLLEGRRGGGRRKRRDWARIKKIEKTKGRGGHVNSQFKPSKTQTTN